MNSSFDTSEMNYYKSLTSMILKIDSSLSTQKLVHSNSKFSLKKIF